ncbi:uncharacterized protein LAJ45_07488 [Morchella importuna]|nr:uncharacterized protein LAJ45_07488 [Morchella importuna]KAH8148386.1 hypothetical protein LAJ45_07488 [Morchella importuna]
MVQITLPAHLTAAISLYNSLPTTTDPINTTTPSIDHHTIHRISRALTRAHNVDTYRFSALLKGCSVYTLPKPPKPVPTPEYTALMGRLRAEEEARAYAALTRQPHTSADDEDGEYTINDLKSHLSIIANILLSVVATSVAVWMVANSWDVPERLALAMTCSLVVAIAEVVVFGGYVRRIEESRSEEKKRCEVKEVVKSWEIKEGVVDRGISEVGAIMGLGGKKGSVVTTGKDKVGKQGVRKRKG